MRPSAALSSFKGVAAVHCCEDAQFRLQSGRLGLFLKLRGDVMRHARLAGGNGGQKRTRDCRETTVAVEEKPGDVASAVLCGVCGVATRLFQGVELRHAELRAIHVACEAEDANRRLGERGEDPITLTSIFSLDSFAGLHTLDLECNCLGDEGITKLCLWCLPQLCFLKRLFVASNGFGVSGLRAIVNYTEGNASGTDARMPSAFSPNNITETKLHPLEAVGLTNNPLFSNDKDEEVTDLLSCLLHACGPLLRRLHLNHVGMPTSSAVTMVQVCFAGDKVRPQDFQDTQLTVYLKQNYIDKEQFYLTLRDLEMGAAARMFLV
ncbi:hypothetical protein C3747_68g165 [Trypanosoma cruzi]|uniref:Leucine-rich repeat protein (LRRP) n=2 Tax=Trypanosoma cruzi TaxID=5693 RepID=Q4DWN1_TRYCC|nr:hypothetical protein, conserved [Trypanosoma cruzi]EAN96929.1 hypothetical protein, conserved [Trypanosoma cruzi]PWV10519.1 hypothetical protein C3747_68g165 [Trypanosoma cruzi]RNC61405.1 hypothetical protein TcCL_ESM00911 [Trypanosoma cruzi]|eukprot:XP_818780.1 hypothetical protein [Trypanosoma cruzi strain CL Brener]